MRIPWQDFLRPPPVEVKIWTSKAWLLSFPLKNEEPSIFFHRAWTSSWIDLCLTTDCWLFRATPLLVNRFVWKLDALKIRRVVQSWEYPVERGEALRFFSKLLKSATKHYYFFSDTILREYRTCKGTHPSAHILDTCIWTFLHFQEFINLDRVTFSNFRLPVTQPATNFWNFQITFSKDVAWIVIGMIVTLG